MKGRLFIYFLIIMNVSSCDSSSVKIDSDKSVEVESLIVRGTVVKSTIVSTLDGLILQIIELNDGKRYLYQPTKKNGIGINFDVELEIAEREPLYYKEIATYYADLISVEKARITAIPAPSGNYKLKYPLTTPPTIVPEHKNGKETKGKETTK